MLSILRHIVYAIKLSLTTGYLQNLSGFWHIMNLTISGHSCLDDRQSCVKSDIEIFASAIHGAVHRPKL